MSNDELYHYGVPGMKWGERKASSKSTQTRRPAKKKVDDQKKKNNQSTNSQQQNSNSKPTNNQPNKSTIDINKIKNKKVSDMSNEELKALTTRGELEEKYRKQIQSQNPARNSTSNKKKNLNDMSDEEVKSLSERLENESKVNKFNPKGIAKGLAIAAAVAVALGTIHKLYTSSRDIMNDGKEIMGSVKKKKVKDIAKNTNEKKPNIGEVMKTTSQKFTQKVNSNSVTPENAKTGTLSTKTFIQKFKSMKTPKTNNSKNVGKNTSGHTKVGMTAIQNFIKKHPSTGVSSLNKSTVNSGQSLVQSFLNKYPKRTLTSV